MGVPRKFTMQAALFILMATGACATMNPVLTPQEGSIEGKASQEQQQEGTIQTQDDASKKVEQPVAETRAVEPKAEEKMAASAAVAQPEEKPVLPAAGEPPVVMKVNEKIAEPKAEEKAAEPKVVEKAAEPAAVAQPEEKPVPPAAGEPPVVMKVDEKVAELKAEEKTAEPKVVEKAAEPAAVAQPEEKPVPPAAGEPPVVMKVNEKVAEPKAEEKTAEPKEVEKAAEPAAVSQPEEKPASPASADQPSELKAQDVEGSTVAEPSADKLKEQVKSVKRYRVELTYAFYGHGMKNTKLGQESGGKGHTISAGGGTGLSVSGGYEYSPQIDLDMTLGRQESSLTPKASNGSATFTRNMLLATALYKIPLSEQKRVKVGGGVGLYTGGTLAIDFLGAPSGYEAEVKYKTALGMHATAVYEWFVQPNVSVSGGVKYTHVQYHAETASVSRPYVTVIDDFHSINGSGFDFMLSAARYF